MDCGAFSWAATSELVIRSNSLWSKTGFSVAFRVESSSNAILAGVSAVMHAVQSVMADLSWRHGRPRKSQMWARPEKKGRDERPGAPCFQLHHTSVSIVVDPAFAAVARLNLALGVAVEYWPPPTKEYRRN
jgi:hypothetical protein